jgi:flagellar basal-body rod protein FlgG
MEINLPKLKQALIGQNERNSIISNNLANLNTIGFKRDVLFSEALNDEIENEIKLIQETDFGQGQLKETNNDLDLAISGNGFFTVETQNGLGYTRDGHFKMDAEGVLRSSSGDPVLGINGWIALIRDGLPAKEVIFAENGEVFVDGEYYDQLLISDFESYETLQKSGHNLFNAGENTLVYEVEEARIKQGFLEESNVNPAQEMIDLIEVQRQFESVQKMVRTLDDTFRLAVNQVGRFR